MKLFNYIAKREKNENWEIISNYLRGSRRIPVILHFKIWYIKNNITRLFVSTHSFFALQFLHKYKTKLRLLVKLFTRWNLIFSFTNFTSLYNLKGGKFVLFFHVFRRGNYIKNKWILIRVPDKELLYSVRKRIKSFPFHFPPCFIRVLSNFNIKGRVFFIRLDGASKLYYMFSWWPHNARLKSQVIRTRMPLKSGYCNIKAEDVGPCWWGKLSEL